MIECFGEIFGDMLILVFLSRLAFFSSIKFSLASCLDSSLEFFLVSFMEAFLVSSNETFLSFSRESFFISSLTRLSLSRALLNFHVYVEILSYCYGRPALTHDGLIGRMGLFLYFCIC